MTSIDAITIEVADLPAAERFYADAFGLDERLRLRESTAPSSGFRGFTLSLTVPGPSDVDVLVDAAVAAGATPVRPAAKSLWGYGGVVTAPDGTIWKVASSAKKDSGVPTGRVDAVVLLIGAADVAAGKQFYLDRGFAVERAFGRMYVEFAPGPITLGLYRRRALAKAAGVSPDGAGSHRVAMMSSAAPFTDPDGFTCETTARAVA